MTTARLTLAAAKTALRAHRMTITKRDGEYRVAPDASWSMTQGQQEAVAHYSDDLADAVATGEHMAGELGKAAAPVMPAVAPRFKRLASLVARRNLLNAMGQYRGHTFDGYADEPVALDSFPHRNGGEWNRRRIKLRNRLNGMIQTLAAAL